MTDAEKRLMDAKFAVLDRMETLGWIRDYKRDGYNVACVPTAEGRAIMREIERLFFSGGKPMDGAELTAFCLIVKGFEGL